MRSPRFEFPNPVNETSARLVAGGVVLEAVAFLVFREFWLLLPLAYGFLARVLTGPRFSPLALIVTKFVTPRLHVEHVFVPGPPKRFAQGVGAVFTTGAVVAWASGSPDAATLLISALLVCATLESVFAFCLGCAVFSRLMRWGVIPERVCIECADITRRFATASH